MQGKGEADLYNASASANAIAIVIDCHGFFSRILMSIPTALVLSILLTFGAAADDRPDFARDIVTLERSDGSAVRIEVEIAETPFQHQYGLMFIQNLPDLTGMLFVFPKEAPRSFWMKNTMIPLDMLFFASDGSLVNAVLNVPAESLTSRRSDGPARYVLELNGGSFHDLALDGAVRLRLPEPWDRDS